MQSFTINQLTIKEINMKLTIDEINSIAYRLDEIIGDNFHDACWNIISERETNYNFEVSDEDIYKIKTELTKFIKHE